MYIANLTSENISFEHENVDIAKEVVARYPKGDNGYTLLFFPKGNVFLDTGSAIEKLSNSEVVLIPNDATAKIVNPEGKECEVFSVCAPYEMFERFHYFIQGKDVKRIRCSSGKELVEIFQKIEFYLLNLSQDESPDVFQTFFRELLYYLKIQETPLIATYNDQGYPPIFIDVLHYVNKNLFAIRNVTDISSAVYISYPYLIKLFKKYKKTTPKKYITEQRLIAANKLILKGERPASVYEKCGFETYRMFYRCYVSYFGSAPSKHGLSDKLEETEEL